MKRIFPSLCTIATVSLIALAGCQSTQKQTASSRFASADLNKDGKLSLDEANRYYVLAVFQSLDKNKDGKLVLKECAVVGSNGSVDYFKVRDLNKDGVVTKEEALQYGRTKGLVKKAFAKADKNKDGYLSPAEVNAFYGDKEGSPF